MGASQHSKGIRKTVKIQSARARADEIAYGSRWAILILLFVLQADTSLGTRSFGPLASFLQDDLNISRAEVGMFFSVVFGSGLFAAALCGWLIDKFGVRRFLLLGPGILGLFLIALTRVPSFEIALFFVFLGTMMVVLSSRFMACAAIMNAVHVFPERVFP